MTNVFGEFGNWTTIFWVPAIAIAFLSVWAIAFNFSVLVRHISRASRVPSIVPLLGAFCGALALLICPWRPVAAYWWVPVVIDPGTWWLVALVPYAVWQRRTKCP